MVMAYVVMALFSYDIYSYGIFSYGIYNYGYRLVSINTLDQPDGPMATPPRTNRVTLAPPTNGLSQCSSNSDVSTSQVVLAILLFICKKTISLICVQKREGHISCSAQSALRFFYFPALLPVLSLAGTCVTVLRFSGFETQKIGP